MPPDEDEIERAERFLAAFNAIDAHLQGLFAAHNAGRSNVPEHQSFRSLVDWFARSSPWWPHAEPLRLFTSLRNMLVHETLAPRAYPCVPSHETTEKIEAIRDDLMRPERALPRWKKSVLCLQADDPLRHALRQMDDRGFGVFPVYEKKRFRGVLSESDLARWLASHAKGEVDLDRAHVRDVLDVQSRRRGRSGARPSTWEWIEARASTREVAHLFHANTCFEAVLVSQNGRDDEEPQGIVTRADVLSWEGTQ